MYVSRRIAKDVLRRRTDHDDELEHENGRVDLRQVPDLREEYVPADLRYDLQP